MRFGRVPRQGVMMQYCNIVSMESAWRPVPRRSPSPEAHQKISGNSPREVLADAIFTLGAALGIVLTIDALVVLAEVSMKGFNLG
jgi:hypothetical protein